ncbi:Ig-like domain-containing protein, partial [candidate division KSB1 bacterium]|nr:Ig-like domain-containing protein [candidate division KSB1 bacterium]
MKERFEQLYWLLALNIFLLCLGCFLRCDTIIGIDNTPPKVTITYPINGSTVSECTLITCVATDNEGINKITLWVDGKPIEGVEDRTEPYELIWNTIHLKNGSSHTITVRAIDKSDNKTDSAPIVLIVDNSNSYPTKVAIEYIQYENNTFIVKWQQSPDHDFYSYRLFESISENMSGKLEIFSPINRIDTSYVVQNITEGEIRYYQIVVVDTIGLETASSIRKASAKKSTFPIDGLIAYYPFHGNADDESGNNNHGTVYGATLSFDRFGNPNRAYYFDGQDDYVVINESKSLEPDDFSIVIWMKTKTLLTETYQTLLIKEDGWNDGFKIIIRSDRRDNYANTILFTVSGP